LEQLGNQLVPSVKGASDEAECSNILV